MGKGKPRGLNAARKSVPPDIHPHNTNFPQEGGIREFTDMLEPNYCEDVSADDNPEPYLPFSRRAQAIFNFDPLLTNG